MSYWTYSQSSASLLTKRQASGPQPLAANLRAFHTAELASAAWGLRAGLETGCH